MKKTITAISLLFLIGFAWTSDGAPTAQDLKKVVDSVSFKHAWKVKPFFDSYEFVSTYKAPFPFSQKEEAEAVMILGMSPDKVSPGTRMEKILKEEIVGIQKELRVTEYLEKDYKPVNNIVSYTQKIGNSDVGFLQYRIRGEKSESPIQPRSIKQVLFVKGDQLYIITLMVLFAGHQEEVRADQMALSKALINSSL